MISAKIKTYRQLFVPSAAGVIFYTFIAALVVALHQFEFISQYLQFPGDINFLRMFTGWLDRTVTGRIGEGNTANLVVGLFWAFIGLVVYLFLRGIIHFINDLSEGLDGRGYIWPQGASRNQALVEAGQRTVFRLLASVGLVLVLFGPLARLVNGPILTDVFTAIRLLVWFICLWLTLHLCVVLVRMIALKPRLFS